MRQCFYTAQHQHYRSNFNFNLSTVLDVNFYMTQKRKAYNNEIKNLKISMPKEEQKRIKSL